MQGACWKGALVYNAEIKNVLNLRKDFMTQLFSIHSWADDAMVMEEFPSDSTEKRLDTTVDDVASCLKREM